MGNKTQLDLSAEAYFLTTFQSRVDSLAHFFLDTKGTKERGRNREVIGHQHRTNVLADKFISMEGMEVSRNGMYDLLPETLFHALTIGRNATNTYEVVDEIRKSRAQEQDDRLFFAPFDTELFLAKAELLHAELDLDGLRAELWDGILKALNLEGNELARKASFDLLELLVQGQLPKDQPKIIEELLSNALECTVVIELFSPETEEYEVLALGETRLSVNSILSGPLQLEGDDWRVKITSNDAVLLSRAVTDPELNRQVLELIEFFALAPRSIHLQWRPTEGSLSSDLGQGRLGVNLSTLSLN